MAKNWRQLFAQCPPMSAAYRDARYVADLLEQGVTRSELWAAFKRGELELSRVDLTAGLDRGKLRQCVEPVRGTRFDRVWLRSTDGGRTR